MSTTPKAPGSSFVPGSVEADGFTIRYHQAGDGEPLVAIHGGGGIRFSFAYDILAERFRVILIELPGFGDEINERTQSLADMGDSVDQATRELGLDSYHLLGTSFGGAVATHLTLGHADRVRTLALEAPAVFRVGGVAPGPDMDPDAFVRGFRTHPEREPALEMPDFEKMGQIWPLVERLIGATGEYDEALAQRLALCSVPTVVLFGENDGVVPPDNGRTYPRVMPECASVLIHDAAHDVQADQPEVFAAVVSGFIAGGPSFTVPAGAASVTS